MFCSHEVSCATQKARNHFSFLFKNTKVLGTQVMSSTANVSKTNETLAKFQGDLIIKQGIEKSK